MNRDVPDFRKHLAALRTTDAAVNGSHSFNPCHCFKVGKLSRSIPGIQAQTSAAEFVSAPHKDPQVFKRLCHSQRLNFIGTPSIRA